MVERVVRPRTPKAGRSASAASSQVIRTAREFLERVSLNEVVANDKELDAILANAGGSIQEKSPTWISGGQAKMNR